MSALPRRKSPGKSSPPLPKLKPMALKAHIRTSELKQKVRDALKVHR